MHFYSYFVEIKIQRDPHIVFGLYVSLFFFFFWPHQGACRILVSQSGIKPMYLAGEVWSTNQWTTREFLVLVCLINLIMSNISSSHLFHFFLATYLLEKETSNFLKLNHLSQVASSDSKITDLPILV